MYCGNCFRDNALVGALRRLGHDAVMVPMYLPMTLDEGSTAGSVPTFFGGINVYLSQKLPGYRFAPAWLRRWADAPWILRWASGRAARTRPQEVGELNVSMLRGESGSQRRELEELTGWLRGQERPEVVFLSNALLVGMARAIRSAVGCPVIGFFQSEESFLDAIPEPWRSESWKVLAGRAGDLDGWIAPTRYFADRMQQRLGLAADRVRVVHNGILLDGYASLERKPAGVGPPVLGFFGRQCPEKGLDILVGAYLELRRRGRVPGIRLKVGGGCGPLDEPFVGAQKERLREAGALVDAEFHPNVSRDEKLRFYASCDVLCVPVRQSEAFGLYVIESLAAGTPLVLPEVSTFPELLGLTGGGELCGANEPGAIAAGVERLLLDPGRARALGEAGRRAVLSGFSDEAMARGILAAAAALTGR